MKPRYTILLVGFFAALSWWLLSTEQEKQIARSDNKHFIDAFINHFTLTSTDESGNIDYILKAERLEHYQDEDHSKITLPVVHFPQQDAGWQISANYGEVYDEKDIIKLRDNVVMTQLNSTAVFIIKAQTMTINVKTKIIESDQAVHIHRGDIKLEALGMHFDGNQEILRLLTNVRGVYNAK